LQAWYERRFSVHFLSINYALALTFLKEGFKILITYWVNGDFKIFRWVPSEFRFNIREIHIDDLIFVIIFFLDR
jgi:hypothetical protein